MQGYRGKKAIHSNQSFKKTAKCGFIGVKCSLSQSFIQIERKIRDYRGKMQFTEIIHSKNAQNTGSSG
jgi:hypothetical protein